MHATRRQEVEGFAVLWLFFGLPMLIVLGLCLWFFRVVWLTLELALVAGLLLYGAVRQLALHVERPRALS